jgi:uncharacterized membrane protein AbrB (regulator of aidB expression)
MARAAGRREARVVAGVRPYLATTPGGIDSITGSALGSGANVPLVLAIHARRIFVVFLTAPSPAKLIVRAA